LSVPYGVLVPGLPQPLLCPEKNEGWMRIRRAFEAARAELLAAEVDLIIVYSTMWSSVIGHQIQADPKPVWVHVDELFHELGSIPYEFRIDAPFAAKLKEAVTARGLVSRTVSYHGFPIDTGSVVALKLLNPDNAIPATILSSNVYSDRAETIVLGKGCRDAIEAEGRKAAIVVVSTLSNRLFTDWIDPAQDRIHSLKDDEWNRKILEFLGEGRLEDTAQLSREINRQIRVPKVVNFKPMWFWSAVMGQHNRYVGKIHAYEPIFGTGGAVVSLTPSPAGVGEKEFDEDDVEIHRGDRNVIS
jgi:2-aminophenol/2-amino-5-chlorophenol 1,6-dioxygenase alpha subunit